MRLIVSSLPATGLKYYVYISGEWLLLSAGDDYKTRHMGE